jgi:hypothetical protein
MSDETQLDAYRSRIAELEDDIGHAQQRIAELEHERDAADEGLEQCRASRDELKQAAIANETSFAACQADRQDMLTGLVLLSNVLQQVYIYRDCWQVTQNLKDQVGRALNGLAFQHDRARLAADANLGRELVAVLIEVAGDGGVDEGAVECCKRIIQERNKARADYQFMVDRVADQRLDGYRELGTQIANLANQLEEANGGLRVWRDQAMRWMDWAERLVQPPTFSHDGLRDAIELELRLLREGERRLGEEVTASNDANEALAESNRKLKFAIACLEALHDPPADSKQDGINHDMLVACLKAVKS